MYVEQSCQTHNSNMEVFIYKKYTVEFINNGII